MKHIRLVNIYRYEIRDGRPRLINYGEKYGLTAQNYEEYKKRCKHVEEREAEYKVCLEQYLLDDNGNQTVQTLIDQFETTWPELVRIWFVLKVKKLFKKGG